MSSGRVCVRRLFVLRSVASCVAFVLCWFVWRSCAAADRAAAHRGKPKTADCGSEAKGGGRYTGWPRAGYGLRTDGRRAGIGQTWTNPAIPRWAAARGGWTCHGRETDTPRATHGRFPYGRTTGGRRTGNGHQTGGGRAGIRLLPTFCDIPRWAAAWRTWDGLLTGGRRTAGTGRPPYHGLLAGGGSPDRIAAISLNWNQSYIKITRLPMQGGPRKKSIACQSGQGGEKGGWAFALARYVFCLY